MKYSQFNYIEHLTVTPVKSVVSGIADVSADTSKLAKVGSLAADTSKLKYMEEVLATAKKVGDKDYVTRITKEIDTLKSQPTFSTTMYKKPLQPTETVSTPLAKTSSDTLKPPPIAQSKTVLPPPLPETTETVAKTTIKDAAKKVKTAKEFLAENKNYIGYSIGGIAITTIATIAGVNSEKINNTTYSITSIYKDSTNPSYTIITYTPNDKFAINDTVTITNSNSIDSIDGRDIPIYDVIGSGKIKINKSIKVDGNYGILTCSTNFGNQVGKTIDEIATPVISGTVQAAASITSSTVGTTLGAFGLNLNQISENLKTYWWIILLICLIPLLSSSLILIASQL